MKGQGHRIFVDELARFAAGLGDARVTAIAGRLAAPLCVAVRGRPGVGRGTVTRALRAVRAEPGAFRVTPSAEAVSPDADLVVHVLAEVAKPEDVDAIATAGRPVLAVLNKADLVGSLSGRTGDGPMAAARTRCAGLSPLVGVPVEPMIGLLAVAAVDGLDPGLWAALRVLATRPGPADLFDASCDGFLAAEAAVPADVRRRLLDALDLFGSALAVAAVRRGGTPAQVLALLRRVSGVDAVVDGLSGVGAEVRYRRVLDAVAELEALAAGRGAPAERISAFLACDDTVVARMAAALDVAEAAGLDAGPVCSDGPDAEAAAHLPRAVRWQRYSRGGLGPVSELHRACGADIARGSLRLWSHAHGSLPGAPVQWGESR